MRHRLAWLFAALILCSLVLADTSYGPGRFEELYCYAGESDIALYLNSDGECLLNDAESTSWLAIRADPGMIMPLAAVAWIFAMCPITRPSS